MFNLNHVETTKSKGAYSALIGIQITLPFAMSEAIDVDTYITYHIRKKGHLNGLIRMYNPDTGVKPSFDYVDNTLNSDTAKQCEITAFSTLSNVTTVNTLISIKDSVEWLADDYILLEARLDELKTNGVILMWAQYDILKR